MARPYPRNNGPKPGEPVIGVCASRLVASLEEGYLELRKERDALEAELCAMEKCFGVKRGSHPPAPDHPDKKRCKEADKRKEKEYKITEPVSPSWTESFNNNS